jgi:AcrR family transcriptional regulator
MDTKHALLQVAVEIFADSGWRGTTTRRVAEAAGVNEVTLFRHFGSKEALLQAAIQWVAARDLPPRLPETPEHLRTELLGWSLGIHLHATRHAKVIRTALAEFEEHPELAPVACEGSAGAGEDAVRYLTRARELGLIAYEGSLEAATMMLMQATFMDGITRGVVSGCDLLPADEAVQAFVDLTLRALDAQVTT